MKTKLFVILAAMATVVSCEEEPLIVTGDAGDGKSFKIELKASSAGNITRITESEDAQTGLRTAWEAGEKINALYYINGGAAMAELVSPSGDGLFTGEVESGEHAQAFASGDVVCVTSSSKIETVLDGMTVTSTVDFTGQDGTLQNVSKYELMFVKGKASRKLCFEHQTSVLKLSFTGLAGTYISSASLSFIPSNESDFLFASSAVYRAGLGGISCETVDATFYEMQDIDIPISDGRATLYLVLPARGKLKGELSVFLGCDDVSYRRYIKLNGKSFKACNVVARTETVSDDDMVPDIGDYVYSDGTWGHLAYYDDKWPQAVIFSNFTSAADRAAGYTHGYAMALRDAAWPTEWAPESEVVEHPDYPEAPNEFESISESAPLHMMENLDGLSTCILLNNLYLHDYAQGNYYGLPGFEKTGKRAAIPCAMRYGKEDWVSTFSNTENICAFEAPANTSGWFLPSAGQWYLCLANLGGIDPNKLEMTTSGNQVLELAWRFSSSAERQWYLNKFIRYFNSSSIDNPILAQYADEGRMVGTIFYLPLEQQMDWYLWTCGEATSDGTATVVYLDATDIVFRYVSKQTGEDSMNGYAARSILAF